MIAPRTLATLAALAFGGLLVLDLAQAIRGICCKPANASSISDSTPPARAIWNPRCSLAYVLE